MKNRPRIGLKDIAADTGVSSSAVSLVLNNRPGVSEETRRRVHAAAQRLGYAPRRAANAAPANGSRQAIASGGLRSIGFLAFGVNAALDHSYYGGILSGVSAEARRRGAKLVFEAIDDLSSDATALPVSAAEGLLLTGRPPREYVLRLRRERVPYVLVCCSLAHLPGDTIGPENVESSYDAVRHLASLGHRRIAYLGGEPANTDARERYLGYRWAVEDLGLDDDDRLALLSFFDTEHGVSGLRSLLDQAGTFSALYAASDFLAMGVYRSAREIGISIPDQLSVVGFDNNALAETLHPTLTTMALDRERVGRLAVRRLSEIVGGASDPIATRVPVERIERASCAAPYATE